MIACDSILSQTHTKNYLLTGGFLEGLTEYSPAFLRVFLTSVGNVGKVVSSVGITFVSPFSPTASPPTVGPIPGPRGLLGIAAGGLALLAAAGIQKRG